MSETLFRSLLREWVDLHERWPKHGRHPEYVELSERTKAALRPPEPAPECTLPIPRGPPVTLSKEQAAQLLDQPECTCVYRGEPGARFIDKDPNCPRHGKAGT